MKQIMPFIFSLSFVLLVASPIRTAEINEDLDKTFFPIAGNYSVELR
jgi:hypothetical protein